jgi:DNA-binding transcriptional regulator YiaG
MTTPPDLTIHGMTPTALKSLRRTLALTQAQLAAALGVQLTTVARWEQGARKIPALAVTALTLYAERAATTTPSTSARPTPGGRRRRAG